MPQDDLSAGLRLLGMYLEWIVQPLPEQFAWMQQNTALVGLFLLYPFHQPLMTPQLSPYTLMWLLAVLDAKT
jgi:hypothetical protein